MIFHNSEVFVFLSLFIHMAALCLFLAERDWLSYAVATVSRRNQILKWNFYHKNILGLTKRYAKKGSSKYGEISWFF